MQICVVVQSYCVLLMLPNVGGCQTDTHTISHRARGLSDSDRRKHAE